MVEGCRRCCCVVAEEGGGGRWRYVPTVQYRLAFGGRELPGSMESWLTRVDCPSYRGLDEWSLGMVSIVAGQVKRLRI